MTPAKGACNEVDDLIEARRYREAVARCDAALIEHPQSVELLRARVELRRRFGDTVGAIEDANRIVVLRPDDASSYLDRGWISYRRGGSRLRCRISAW